jgi:predicted MFS family arabinose efflux permease
MRTSIGVGAGSTVGAGVLGQLPVLALGLAAVVVAVCCTIVVLSKMNRRPPRVDLGSFHLSFDDEEADSNA